MRFYMEGNLSLVIELLSFSIGLIRRTRLLVARGKEHPSGKNQYEKYSCLFHVSRFSD